MDQIFTQQKVDGTETIPVSKLSNAVFVDTSGSTTYYSNGRGEKFINVEMKIVREFLHNVPGCNIVGWSTRINHKKNDNSIYVDGGGTDPSCIFKDAKAKKMFEDCSVLTFITDGEISAGSVTKFSKEISSLNKTLVICCLVSNSYADQNVSVFAPLLNAPNVLCLHYNGDMENDASVLVSKGCVEQRYAKGTVVSINDLPNINLSDRYSNVPKGNLVIRDSDNIVVSMDVNRFYSLIESSSITWADVKEHIANIDFDVVTRHAKVNNDIDRLRKVVNKLEQLYKANVKEDSATRFDMAYTKKKDELVARLTEMRANGEDISGFKEELKDLTNQSRIEELEYAKFLKEEMATGSKLFESVKANLHAMEKASYSLNEYMFSSNRAQRAKTISDNVDELEATLVHVDVPEQECVILMDESPAVLWLRKPDTVEETTNDHVINFPLDEYPKLQNCMVSNPVSADCAAGFVKNFTSKNQRPESVYHQPLDGYVPLNFKLNSRFITHELCRIMFNGKLLHHAKMLLLSMVDDNETEWFAPIKEHVTTELLNSIRTTVSFNEEGERIPLIDALKQIESNSTSLYGQPLKAALRIIRLANKYAGVPTDVCRTLAQRRFSYFLVEVMANSIKPKGNRELEMQLIDTFHQKLENMVFDTICGIPVY